MFSATSAGRIEQEADRADHAAVAGATATEPHPADAHPPEQRQEEGVCIPPAVGAAAAATDPANAADAEAVRGPSGDGNAASDAAPSR